MIKPLVARNPTEGHRAATGLHHGIAENHILEGSVSYLLVFFLFGGHG